MSSLQHSESVVVASTPEALYDMVSDVTRMGEWSPVCAACWWDDGDGPRVGGWFTGRNELPERTWETRSQVVAADPGREFAFEVNGGWVRWSYAFTAVDTGTQVTESWEFLPAWPGSTTGTATTPRLRSPTAPSSRTGAFRSPWPRSRRPPKRTDPRYDHPVTSTDIPALLRRGAVAVAAGRVALGLTALAWPAVPARPWVGAAADDLAARVFGRALGARDIALGLGALAALQRTGAEPGSASAWVAAGALSDALDVAASLASWRELPRVTRWLVAASAGGAALTGAAAAVTSATSRAPSASS